MWAISKINLLHNLLQFFSMPQILIAKVLGMFVGYSLIIDFCAIDRTIEFTPQAVEQGAFILPPRP